MISAKTVNKLTSRVKCAHRGYLYSMFLNYYKYKNAVLLLYFLFRNFIYCNTLFAINSLIILLIFFCKI